MSTGAPPVKLLVRAAAAWLGHVYLPDADGFAGRQRQRERPTRMAVWSWASSAAATVHFQDHSDRRRPLRPACSIGPVLRLHSPGPLLLRLRQAGLFVT